MVNILIFDGTSSKDLGLNVAAKNAYDASSLDYSAQAIPGRNGDLLFSNNRNGNISLTYTLMWRKDAQNKMMAVRRWIYRNRGKYCRLEDGYDPEVFRMAYFVGPFQANTFRNSSGTVDVTFSAKPQRFLKSGETPIVLTASSVLENPGEEAKPLIRIYGKGTLTIENSIVEVKEAGNEFIDLDCDTMNASERGLNRNDLITVKSGLTEHMFPMLATGQNEISLGAGITKVEITPRWWII